MSKYFREQGGGGGETILGIKKLGTREQGPSPGRACLLYSQISNKVGAVCHTLSTLFGIHVRTYRSLHDLSSVSIVTTATAA